MEKQNILNKRSVVTFYYPSSSSAQNQCFLPKCSKVAQAGNMRSQQVSPARQIKQKKTRDAKNRMVFLRKLDTTKQDCFKNSLESITNSGSKFFLNRTPSLWNKSYFKKQREQLAQSNTFNKSIAKTLKQNRELMNRTINKSKQVMNCSYSNFYCTESKYQQLITEVKKKKKQGSPLQYINTNNSTATTRRKIDLTTVKELGSNNNEQAVTQYRFHTVIMPNKCYDSTFPKIRRGSTLVASETNLFLLGGYSQKGIDQPLSMHKYQFQQKQWVQVNTSMLKSRKNIMNGMDPPSVSCCYHTAQNYKSYLLLIGGMGMDIRNKKRIMNNDINFFNTERKEWGRIRWQYCVRSHASTLYGNTLIVYGGINQKEQYLNEIRLVTLNSLNLSSSYHYQLGIKNFYRMADDTTICKSLHEPIAHHQMVNTYEVDPMLLKNMPINAIFVFGGKKQNGKVDNVLRYMEYSKLVQLGQSTTTRVKISQLWSVAQVSGQKPEARYCHSMTMIKKKGLALLVGGKDGQGNALSDSWVLDFVRLSWIRVLYVQPENPIQTKSGIFGHSATCVNNHFYIFGGIFGNNQFNTSFFDMNYQFRRVQRRSKKIQRTSKLRNISINETFLPDEHNSIGKD